MVDKLKTVPILGAPGAAFGLTSVVDNHGNRLTGNELTCGANPPVKLNAHDWEKLHTDIWEPSGAQALMDFRLDGEIPILGGMESPLKIECDKLQSQKKAHLSPTRKK